MMQPWNKSGNVHFAAYMFFHLPPSYLVEDFLTQNTQFVLNGLTAFYEGAWSPNGVSRVSLGCFLYYYQS